MKKKYRLLTCLLVFMLGLTGCTTDGYNIPQPQAEVVPEHSDLNFEDMSYERPDIDAINQKIKANVSLLSTATTKIGISSIA